MGSGLSMHKNGDATTAYVFGPHDLIGNGKGSSVFKATLVDHNRVAMDRTTWIPDIVAIKVIDKATASTHELDRAFDEAKFLTRFRHGIAVRVFEYFETPTSFCLVMEYLQGGNIYTLISQRGHLSEQETASVIQQLSSLLSSMAAVNFSHRDIRGENILFVDRISTRVRLVNFGNVTHTKHSRIAKRLSIHGADLFLAPESTTSYQDPKVDVWAIGVLMYYLLSGTFPFRSSDSKQAQSELLSQLIHPVLSFHHPIWNQISNEAITMIKKLLVVDSEKRMSANEILKDPWIKKYADVCIEEVDYSYSQYPVSGESFEEENEYKHPESNYEQS